jgi:hypothetical protein
MNPCYFNFEFELIQMKTAFKFEIWNLIWQLGFGSFDPTGPPGSVKPDRLRSGSVNRPSPAPSLTLSPLRALWRTLSHRRHRLANPAISGGLRHQCLGQNRRPSPLYHLLQLESAETSPPGRSGVVSPRYPPMLVASDLLPCRAFSSVLVVPPPVLVMHEYSPVEVLWCGAPGGCSVKSSSGSLWPAAQALPCHAIQTSTWATVSVISSPSNLLLLLWPRSLANWSRSVSQAHRPCSVMLLTVASLI